MKDKRKIKKQANAPKNERKTSIEWTLRVWNYLTGCTKISAGCKNCYMFILALRLRSMGQEKYRNGTQLTVHEQVLDNPYHWKKPTVAFVNSMSDSFHADVPIEIHKAKTKVIVENPQHIFLDLTKRPERVLEIQDELEWPDNLWLGVTVEDANSLHRVDTLRKTKAKHKWISAEPLIAPLTDLNLEGIDWVVVGGESGTKNDLRPIKEEWVIEIMEKCREKGIPFFFKQWGKKHFNPNPNDTTKIKGHPQYAKGGCELQGVVYREFPETINNIIKQTVMNTEENKNGNGEGFNIESLSPFKKQIATALLAGEDKDALATRLAEERGMPRKTAQAYVTMVVKFLSNDTNSVPAQKRSDNEIAELRKSLDKFMDAVNMLKDLLEKIASNQDNSNNMAA